MYLLIHSLEKAGNYPLQYLSRIKTHTDYHVKLQAFQWRLGSTADSPEETRKITKTLSAVKKEEGRKQ